MFSRWVLDIFNIQIQSFKAANVIVNHLSRKNHPKSILIRTIKPYSYCQQKEFIFLNDYVSLTIHCGYRNRYFLNVSGYGYRQFSHLMEMYPDTGLDTAKEKVCRYFLDINTFLLNSATYPHTTQPLPVCSLDAPLQVDDSLHVRGQPSSYGVGHNTKALRWQLQWVHYVH